MVSNHVVSDNVVSDRVKNNYIKNEGYHTIKESATHEIIINKSRFISAAFYVNEEQIALEKIQSIRDKYPDASHHCYAYIIGRKSVVQRFNDDGEPSGTAGMPILQVIEQQCLKNTLVVVTRYFGGIKLGAGGLVRAYSKSAAQVLEKAGKVFMGLCNKIMLSIDYSNLGIIEHFLMQQEIPVIEKNYQDKVYITIVTAEDWEKFSAIIGDLCSGRVKCTLIEQIFYPLDDQKVK